MAEERRKKALVLAGGGIMGAAYEIGCLTALDRIFAPGFSVRDFDMFVGVSAGSVIATLVANKISPTDLFRVVNNNEMRVFNWRRTDIYRRDYREIFADCLKLIPNLIRVFLNYRRNRWKFSWGDLFYILQEQFPSGLYSLEPLENYLCQSFRHEGIRDEFQLLDRELYIPAYDLDLGRRVIFGTEGHRDMHICQAITASCAIPYFFRPCKIGGRHYIDGSIGRVSHIDVALERGAELIVVVNPRVPVANDVERFCLPSLSFGRCSSISDLGIVFATEQAQRIENKEKLDLALELYRVKYPQVDILVIEPGPEEAVLFFQSPMSQTARNHIMNYGFNLTLGELKSRFGEFREVFSRHGIETTRAHLGPLREEEA